MIKPKDMTDEEIKEVEREGTRRLAERGRAIQRERKLKRDMAYAALDNKTMAELADIIERAVCAQPSRAGQARDAFPALQDLFRDYFEDKDNIW